MAFDIQSMIASLDSFGVFQYAIPFFISWLIIFSLFEKTKVLGKDNTVLNGVLSLLISLTVVTNDTLIVFTTRYLSSISMGLVLLTVILLVFLFVNDVTSGPIKFLAVILAAITVIVALVDAQYLTGAYGGSVFWWFNNIWYSFGGLIYFLLGICFVGLILYLIFFRKKNSGP